MLPRTVIDDWILAVDSFQNRPQGNDVIIVNGNFYGFGLFSFIAKFKMPDSKLKMIGYDSYPVVSELFNNCQLGLRGFRLCGGG